MKKFVKIRKKFGKIRYDVIPSEDGSAFLRIGAEESDSSHPRKVFTHQTLSGAVGDDQSFTLKGHNLFGVSSKVWKTQELFLKKFGKIRKKF